MDQHVHDAQPVCHSTDVNDVVESLRFAADHSLRAATYAAGHQVVGVSLLPNGVVIDTKNLTAIDVNPDSQTAYVQAGGGLFFCYPLLQKLGFVKISCVHCSKLPI